MLKIKQDGREWIVDLALFLKLDILNIYIVQYICLYVCMYILCSPPPRLDLTYEE